MCNSLAFLFVGEESTHWYQSYLVDLCAMRSAGLLAAVSIGVSTGGARAFVSPLTSSYRRVRWGGLDESCTSSLNSIAAPREASLASSRPWGAGSWARRRRNTSSVFGSQGGASAADRASQAEARYREALSDAQRATKEYGGDSPQARSAWDVVDELEASNNSIAWKPNLDEACEVGDEANEELCKQYEADLERFGRLMENGPEDAEGEPLSEDLFLNEIKLVPVPSLKTKFPSAEVSNFEITPDTQGGATRYTKLIGERDCVIYEHVRGPSRVNQATAFLRAGPRASLHFKPKEVRAAVVTCGGLCPGLNSVIHHIVVTLREIYGADEVLGIRGGYSGFFDENLPPMKLTTKSVELLQHQGGSVLGSNRGGFDLDKILQFIDDNRISHLYIIGGDGTHRGAVRIAAECMARGKNVAVAGVPKTIDNDLDIIDRSFGFLTSVEAAQDAINSATTEARCAVPNGIGVVKLMGRSAGFIAAFATLASGDVDLCLVPESDIVLDGPRGCLPHVMKRVKEKGYAVVVVAEGAGEEILGETGETDATGHKKHPPIGPFLKEQIEEYFKKHDEVCSVKYIDPSYMIRSVPANSFDQIYCMQLAQNAVHGAMAGYTAFSVGMVNDRIVYLPMSQLVANSPRSINPLGRTWENVLTITRQPSTEGSRANMAS